MTIGQAAESNEARFKLTQNLHSFASHLPRYKNELESYDTLISDLSVQHRQFFRKVRRVEADTNLPLVYFQVEDSLAFWRDSAEKWKMMVEELQKRTDICINLVTPSLRSSITSATDWIAQTDKLSAPVAI
jgi:hypothetical protein